MKIVNIFAYRLLAFKFSDQKQNELERLLNLWNDVNYLFNFVNENKNDIPATHNIGEIVMDLLESAKEIDRRILVFCNNPKKKLDDFFIPLNNHEYKIGRLSRQKGKQNYLRIFAIRIDCDCFIITGGTIKFHHLNREREHTQKEMLKLERCRNYLNDRNVFDADSFYELLIEDL